MTQKALKLALEELAVRFSEGWHEGIKIDASDIMLLNEAAQALAQPEQEPSGHFLDFAYSDNIAYVHVYDQFRKGQQFYKAPPQRTWVGLTDEEISALWNEWKDAVCLDHKTWAKAIEAKLKEKNSA